MFTRFQHVPSALAGRLSVLLCLLMLACSGGDGRDTPSGSLDGRLADNAPASAATAVVELKDFDWAGTQGKVVFLEFWGTWCGPCIRSMPTIQRHWETHRKNPAFRMMAINTGSRGDSPEAVTQWRRANGGFTFPVYHDTDQQLSMKYQVNGIPHSVVLDRNGQVVYSGHPMELPAGLLERLLAAGSTGSEG
jgi:thiol-disulfide isomerase/thioredoxin